MPKRIKNKTWFSFSLTPEERSAFEEKFKTSLCRSRNQYLRSILLDLPVTIRHRNVSVDDYTREMLSFKKELLPLLQRAGHSDSKALLEKMNAILIYVEQQYRLWSHT